MKNIKLKDLMNEASDKDYKKRCESDSVKVANAFLKYDRSPMDDKDYDEYQKLLKKVGIPEQNQSAIEKEIRKSRGNFRHIDVYQYWG